MSQWGVDVKHCLEAPRTWSPAGGMRSWLCFEDEKTVEIGPAEAFEKLALRMLRGDYYPKSVIAFDGPFRQEGRDLQPGDRVLQTATLPPAFLGLKIRSMVEIFVASKDEDRCRIGYVTTQCHFAKGIWQAEIRKAGPKLLLTVNSTASPNSLIYWLTVPIARWLQIRSREKAIASLRREASR